METSSTICVTYLLVVWLASGLNTRHLTALKLYHLATAAVVQDKTTNSVRLLCFTKLFFIGSVCVAFVQHGLKFKAVIRAGTVLFPYRS